jgi:hypothetical protein
MPSESHGVAQLSATEICQTGVASHQADAVSILKSEKSAQNSKKTAKQAKKQAAKKTKTKTARGFIQPNARAWAPSLEPRRCYNWKGSMDVHTVGNAVLVLVPWFAYDYQISGGSIPPGVSVAQALHEAFADDPEVVIAAYSSSKQTGISELIRRRGVTVPFATCANFPTAYRMASEQSSYSYGIIMIDRNGKLALSKTDYSSSEGRGSKEANQFISTIKALKQEQRIAGTPSVLPPAIPEVSDRSMEMVAKSMAKGVIGSNYKKVLATLAKDPEHADALALKDTVDTWLDDQRHLLGELEAAGAIYETASFAEALAKTMRMSPAEAEFKDINKRLRTDPAYKEGQSWNKVVESVYKSPTAHRPKLLAKYLEDAQNPYYRSQAETLHGK